MGLDGILAKLFIDCKDVSAPLLLRLFILNYDNGVYPEQSTNGVTIPISNNKNINDVNNYR